MNDIKPPLATPVPGYYYTQAQEDEISLVDLWLALVRHKVTILVTALLCAAAALALGLTQPEQVQYTSSLHIGSFASEQGARPVEPTEATLAKLNEVYIPLANNHMGLALDLTATSPNNSGLVLLRSVIPPGHGDDAIALHGAVIDSIQKDHAQMMRGETRGIEEKIQRLQIELDDITAPAYLENLQKDLLLKIQTKQQAIANADNPVLAELPLKELEQQISQAQGRLESLKNNAETLRNRQGQLSTKISLTDAEIGELERMISSASQHLLPATQEATNEERAMTLLLLHNTVQQNRSHLATLQRRLHIELPAEKLSLEQQLEENLREQAAQQEHIELLRARLTKHTTEQTLGEQRLAQELRPLQLQLERLKTEHALRVKQTRADLDSLQTRLELIRQTRPLAEPQRTEVPRKSLALMLVLGLMIGLFAGVIIALFRNFLEQVKAGRAAPVR